MGKCFFDLSEDGEWKMIPNYIPKRTILPLPSLPLFPSCKWKIEYECREGRKERSSWISSSMWIDSFVSFLFFIHIFSERMILSPSSSHLPLSLPRWTETSKFWNLEPMAPVMNIDGDLRPRVCQSKGSDRREEREGQKGSLLRIDNTTFPLSFRVSSKKWSVEGKGRGTRET